MYSHMTAELIWYLCSLWSLLNQIPLPPTREVQQELEQLLSADDVGSRLVASAQIQGRLANNIWFVQNKAPEVCLLFKG